jgi:1-aminocyclopropane-1-carboxylate deaminase/D-cysteine desulfhydrase-like pyridoxal-dependent ACC family enzyme
MKREDLIHPQISGNKYWKLFLILIIIWGNPEKPYIITFGGAFSNHIAAVSAVGNLADIPTLGL